MCRSCAAIHRIVLSATFSGDFRQRPKTQLASSPGHRREVLPFRIGSSIPVPVQTKALTGKAYRVKETNHETGNPGILCDCVASTATTGGNGIDTRRRVLDGPHALLPHR